MAKVGAAIHFTIQVYGNSEGGWPRSEAPRHDDWGGCHCEALLGRGNPPK
ncbi:MAG: hypothetical protein K2X02_05000 [Alphaproteobacteria bacterium]|nr:hypothetical protein [Alphaproteobacteria bacterium]